MAASLYEAIQAWWAEQRSTPRGWRYYSTLTISTALTMSVVFGLAMRQSEV